MTFMTATSTKIAGFDCAVSRSGYTGEDGYEISVPAENATAMAEILLAEPDVLPIGLGARDSLRLEAGLCLYGHDIDETTSPVEAALTWAIGKRRKMDKDFPAPRASLASCSTARPQARGHPAARESTRARRHRNPERKRREDRVITSGGFGPTVNAPVAMGYVATAHAKDGTDVHFWCARTPRPARIAPCLSPPIATTRIRGAAHDHLLYQDHEWVRVDGDVATVGITRYRRAAGRCRLRRSALARQGGGAGRRGPLSSKSVKAASDVYAPVSGDVVEGNEALSRRAANGQRRPRRRRLVHEDQGEGCGGAHVTDGRRRL